MIIAVPGIARIGFTGDLMSHLGFVIQEIEGHPFAAHFSPSVMELCQAHDEMWGNLEGPACREEDGLGVHFRIRQSAWCYPKLFFPHHYLKTLRELNFRLLSVANNHSFDFETENDTTISAEILEESGFSPVGLSFKPVVREVNGQTFAVLATTCFLNPPGGRSVALINRQTYPELLQTIRRWRSEVDHVVVMTHWGRDYQGCPPRSVRCLAHELLAAGTAVVYGNHPHVLWPVEQPAANKLIVYSMGNFSQVLGCASCNAYPFLKALYGGILSVTFESGRITPEFYPLFARNNYVDWYHELGIAQSYWSWGEAQVSRWLSTLEHREHRLVTQVERNGDPRPPPADARAVEELYPAPMRRAPWSVMRRSECVSRAGA